MHRRELGEEEADAVCVCVCVMYMFNIYIHISYMQERERGEEVEADAAYMVANILSTSKMWSKTLRHLATQIEVCLAYVSIRQHTSAYV
jgi:RNA:NAD 2'-phosphotransferase (TPT1/KptA family)